MSYQEKRAVVSILAGIGVTAAYCLYAFGKYRAGAGGPEDLAFWAKAMLIFIGIGIAASIVIQIVFHILLSVATAVREQVRTGSCSGEKIEKELAAEMVEDEMDKLVELKSMRVGFVIAGIGFVAGLLSAVLGSSLAVMLNILFLSFCGGSILEGVSQIYFYRRGIRHG